MVGGRKRSLVGQMFSSPPPPLSSHSYCCRSQITIHLKEKCKEFAKPARVKEIIKKYSNFVNFPIKVHQPVRSHVASP